MLNITTTRFGSLEVPETSVVTLKSGMIGFPQELAYVWLPHRNSKDIAWLQSLRKPELAFPVLNAECVGAGYPELPVEQIADQGGVEFSAISELALSVVLNAQGNGAATVNLLAPIVINSVTRTGAQVVLAGTKLSTGHVWKSRATSSSANPGAP